MNTKRLASSTGPSAFNNVVESLVPNNKQVIQYKGHRISTYPKMDKVGVQIDSYLLNRAFNNPVEAIREAKFKVDQLY